MTRDEAIQAITPFVPKSDAEPFVDALAALGILDVAKSLSCPQQALVAKVCSEGFSDLSGRNLVQLVECAGLRLEFK